MQEYITVNNDIVFGSPCESLNDYENVMIVEDEKGERHVIKHKNASYVRKNNYGKLELKPIELRVTHVKTGAVSYFKTLAEAEQLLHKSKAEIKACLDVGKMLDDYKLEMVR